eukprot:gene8578-17694_t
MPFKIWDKISSSASLYPALLVLVSVLSFSILVYLTYGRWLANDSILGRGRGLVAVLYLVLYISTSLTMFMAIILSKKSTTDSNNNSNAFTMCTHCTNVILTYCPLVLLALPSAHYCYSLLFDVNTTSLAAILPLFDMFLPALVWYEMTLAAVLTHLILAVSVPLKISPAGWVTELLSSSDGILFQDLVSSLSHSQSQGNSHSTSNSSNGWKSSGVMCVHEEGGGNAVYEYCKEAAVEVAQGVLIGPAFRVVICACDKDKKLKSSDTWCEWCRCPRCGGQDKHRKNALKTTHYTNYNDITIDLGLGFMLLIIAVCSALYAFDHPYKQMYIMGSIAFSFVIHYVAQYFGF